MTGWRIFEPPDRLSYNLHKNWNGPHIFLLPARGSFAVNKIFNNENFSFYNYIGSFADPFFGMFKR